MRRGILNIFSYAIILLAYTGCDIHEFPTEGRNVVPLTIHLDIDTALPINNTIYYPQRGHVDEPNKASTHNIRYIINAYYNNSEIGENRTADTTFVFTKSDINELDYTARIELHEGAYRLLAWADYVDKESNEDKYYDTKEFSEIIIANRSNYAGSNDYRDTFKGESYIELNSLVDNEVTITMMRPVGKFKFIATNSEAYQNRISDFNVIFRYNLFMPCSFNMFTDRPADSWTNMSFSSSMQRENDSEITLGYDYVFVGQNETLLNISVDIYDKDGSLISSSSPINVPIVRNKLTIVKGDFFSSNASGGTTINPDYDGEDFNIPI